MLSELFSTVLLRYSSARNAEAFSGNELGRIVRKDIPSALRSVVTNPTYIIKGSVGQGGWAAVPWIAIMDGRITTTTQNGVYLVYLYSDDGRALYLTLNQGCTDLIRQHGRRQAKQMLLQNAAEIRKVLLVPDALYDGKPITTGNKYYDLGCIAYREYTVEKFPDDAALKEDLNIFCHLYERYLSQIRSNMESQKPFEEKEDITMQVNTDATVPLDKRPFDLQEAVILLDVYLNMVESGTSTTEAAEKASLRLRALATRNGYAVSDSYRSAKGILGRLNSLAGLYKDKKTPGTPGTAMFVEAISLYRNNRNRYDEILRSEGTEDTCLQLKEELVPYRTEKEYPMEQEFFQWLQGAVSVSTYQNIQKSYVLINTLLVKTKALPCNLMSVTSADLVKNALPQIKRIFANKRTRNTAEKLLEQYLDYLFRDKSESAEEVGAEKSVAELTNGIKPKENWIRFDFTNADAFERTKPAYCSVGGKEYSGRNWARIYVAITENEIQKDNPALRDLTEHALTAKRVDRPFFLNEKIEGQNCERLSNGYWINLNHSIPRLMELIHALCHLCGYSNEEIVLYGVPRMTVSGKTVGIMTPTSASSPKTYTGGIALEDAEKYLHSVGLAGATVQELIEAVRHGAAVYPTRQELEKCMDIVSMPGGKYVHADSFVDLDEAEKIIGKILSTHFAQFDGYSNNQLLFTAAEQDLSMFLNDNDCENIDSVYDIARFLFEKRAVAGHPYKFAIPHIFETEPDYPLTLKGVMINYTRHAGGLLRADEAKEYLKKTLLSYGSIGQLLQISYSDTFLLYNSKSYLLTEMLEIDDIWLSQLHTRLDDLFRQANVAYVIPRDIKSTWFDTLPPLPMNLSWTLFLLQDVMQKFPKVGFKAIKADLNQTYDTVAAAFVPVDSPLQSFPDVVTLFMQDHHRLPVRMACEELRQELREAGMLEGNEMIYALPKALNDYRFAWSDENKTVYVRGN